MSLTTTEGTVLAVTKRPGNFIKNTHIQDDRCNGYDIFYEKSGSNSAKDKSYTVTNKEQQYIPQPKDRFLLIQVLKTTEENINSMIEAVESGDQMVIASKGIDLLNNLQGLWKLRRIRNENWASIINFVQSALSSIELENLSKTQIMTLKKIFDNSIHTGGTDNLDVDRTMDLLEAVELDPWKGISSE